MPLKVIGAGYPRTGTLSLKFALETLGFGPCHHMAELIMHPEQVPLWLRMTDGESLDWDEIYAGYSSTTDAPGCFFWRELAERYPDAKVILSIRSAESWWTSANATVMAAPPPPPVAPLIARLTSKRSGKGEVIPNPLDPDREAAIAAFDRHNEEVRRTIAPERLLVFEARQGWDPLCAFLGVAAPDRPYPRVNTSEEFHGATEALLDGHMPVAG
jgi:hypothetical protein